MSASLAPNAGEANSAFVNSKLADSWHAFKQFVIHPSWNLHTVQGTWTIVITIILSVAATALFLRVAMPVKRSSTRRVRKNVVCLPQPHDYDYILTGRTLSVNGPVKESTDTSTLAPTSQEA